MRSIASFVEFITKFIFSRVSAESISRFIPMSKGMYVLLAEAAPAGVTWGHRGVPGQLANLANCLVASSKGVWEDFLVVIIGTVGRNPRMGVISTM